MAVAVERRPPPAVPGMPAPPPAADGPGPRLVIFGDADMVANGIIQFPGSANEDLVVKAVGWAAREEKSVGGIAPKPRRAEQLEVIPKQRLQSFFFLIVLGLPVLAALLGGLVWWIRRR
jgi:hypothetical protein